MQFDVILGNPPYNNDIYLDFVTLGHRLASKLVCMVTPAKWQAKTDGDNDRFRECIVPYISNIVFYPDCTDVFIIQDAGGITYYLIDKIKHLDKVIENKSRLNPTLNDIAVRPIEYTLHNKGNNIIHKLASYDKYRPEAYSINAYNVYTNNSIALGGKVHKDAKGDYTYLFGDTGMLQCISQSEIVESGGTVTVADSRLSYSSDSLEECKSFISWLNTRFIRYLVFIGLTARNGVISDNAFRFVPDPGAFNHIYTDKELYEKYSISPEEVSLIESIIKERK